MASESCGTTAHFFHANTVAVVAVCALHRGWLSPQAPNHLVVHGVRVSPADVVIDACCSDVGAGHTALTMSSPGVATPWRRTNQMVDSSRASRTRQCGVQELDFGTKRSAKPTGMSRFTPPRGSCSAFGNPGSWRGRGTSHGPHAPGHQVRLPMSGRRRQPHQVRATLALSGDEANVFCTLGTSTSRGLSGVNVGVGPRHGAHVTQAVAIRRDLGEVATRRFFPRHGEM